jgi:hypothetical protein
MGVAQTSELCEVALEHSDIHLIAWTTTLNWGPPTCSSVMAVDGTLFIHGPLHINVANLPSVATRTHFTLLYANAISGQFDELLTLVDANWNFTLQYLNQSVILTASNQLDSVMDNTTPESSDTLDWLAPWQEGSEAERLYLVALAVCVVLIITALASAFIGINYPRFINGVTHDADPSRSMWRPMLLVASLLLLVVLAVIYITDPHPWAQLIVVKVLGTILVTFILMQIYLQCCASRTRTRTQPQMQGQPQRGSVYQVQTEWLDMQIIK